MVYTIPLLVSFMIVFLLVPVVKRIASQSGFVDRPTSRKNHNAPVPLMGGIAIYAGCIVTLLFFDGLTPRSLTLLVGGSMLVVIGLIDDGFKSKGLEFAVWPRILVYLIAASVPIWFGIEIVGITNIAGQGMIMFPRWFVWLASMLWVFAITNMINFIDGVDGLAAGIVALSSLTLFVVAVFTGQGGTALLASILVGVCVAFLSFNFYPAKIFMGDAGAIFLGYALAVLSMDGALKSATVVSIFVPILALGVPIMDTVIVFTRRFIENKGLHHADRLHTHHSLMKKGFSQTQTVTFLYFIGLIFSLLSITLLLTFR